MKKNVLLLIALLLSLTTNAQDSEIIDGIRCYWSPLNGGYVILDKPEGYSGEITIPETINGKRVKEIGERAFYNNQNATLIHLPFSLDRIRNEAFSGCSGISSIEIPQNVRFIDDKAFANCKNIKDIYCYSSVLVMGEDIFAKTKGFTLHVPAGKMSLFKGNKQWKNAKEIVEINRESWALQQHNAELRQKFIQDSIAAREKQIRDSIAAREIQIKDSIAAKEKLDADFAAAKNGDTDALYRLGIRYTDGDGVAKDMNQAIIYFKQAADSGNVKSQVHLGSLYYKGNGVDKDINKALPHLKKAADKGDATAQLYLGQIYYNGEGVKKDEKQALSWFDKSAAQGNEYAIDFKKQYKREHESYWDTEYDWKMIFPNGLIVRRKNDRWVETNNFEIAVSWNKIDEDKFNKILKREEKFNVEGLVIEFGNDRSRQFVHVKKSKLDYYNKLTDNQKNELLKKELSVFSFQPNALIRVCIDDDDYDGVFEKGKFISLSTKFNSICTRLGFNPTLGSLRSIISPGRPLSLIDEYSEYCLWIGRTFYKFGLASDNGATKVYKLYWDGSWVGSMWTRSGKVTSVKWRR